MRLLVILCLITTPALAHDWYSGLKNEKGDSCCGGSDCAPLIDGDVVELKNGYWITSRRVFVPLSRAKPALEEDGHFHACFWQKSPVDPEPANMPKCFFYPNRGY